MSIVSWRHRLVEYKLMVMLDVKTSGDPKCAQEILLGKMNGRQTNANNLISLFTHNPSLNLMPVERL